MAKLLGGYRGRPGTDLDALAQVIASFSVLCSACAAGTAEIDVNPLTVHAKGQGATALDALIVCR